MFDRRKEEFWQKTWSSKEEIVNAVYKVTRRVRREKGKKLFQMSLSRLVDAEKRVNQTARKVLTESTGKAMG